MRARTASRTLRRTSVIAVVLAGACGGPSSPAPAPLRRPLPPPIALPSLIRPARYVATDLGGVWFDPAARAPALIRPEPALLGGNRILVEGGVILRRHSAPDDLAGFSSVPERIGGGYIFWTSERTFRARDFFGALDPIADTASVGGVRPFFKTALLRTEFGIFELDPATGAVRRMAIPGLADALAQDARRALRVDQLGRAAFTVDAGATWTDIAATRGILASGILETEGVGLFVLGSNASELFLDPAGNLVRWDPRSTPDQASRGIRRGSGLRAVGPGDFTSVDTPASTALPSELIAHAAVAGAPLPGGRMLVVSERGLHVFSAGNARMLASSPWLGLSDEYTRCQPISLGLAGARRDRDILLACTHERGAHVLAVEGNLAAPKLEATFPEPAGFVAGLSGRFGFSGRCGTNPPGVADFPRGEGGGGAPPESPDEASKPENLPDDTAYFCIRAGAGHWVERRLSGELARQVYRFLPGDDGTATVLILDPHATNPRDGRATRSVTAPEGIRIFRINPRDPALHGGRFPAVLPLRKELPYRFIETDYWLDEQDGSVRGWILLPSEPQGGPRGTERPSKPTEEEAGDDEEVSPERLGGRVAGVRISPAGQVEVYPVPPGVVEVVRGGPYALALAEVDDKDAYYESTDGGRTWHPVEGPPTGRLRAPDDANEVSGCSALGCAWGDGLVRLGWGSPDKSELPQTGDSPVPSSQGGFRVQRPSPIALTCNLKGPGDILRGRNAKDSPEPITLLTPPKPMGSVSNGTWTAEFALPFGKPSSPRRISLKDDSLGENPGHVVPLLTSSPSAPVDLVVLGRKGPGSEAQGIRVGPGGTRHAWDYSGRIAVMAEMPGGMLVALDADLSILVLARDNAAQPFFRLTRVPDVSRTRLTLALRLDAPGLAVAGVSTTSGDIFAGPVDLVRAEVGPLVGLGNLGSLTKGDAAICRKPAGKGPLYRLLADARLSLTLAGPDDRKLIEPSLQGIALLMATPERLCLDGLLLRMPGVEGASITVDSAGAALVRRGKLSQAAVCSVLRFEP